MIAWKVSETLQSGISLVIDEENPWPALDSFPEAAEQFFNGRKRECDELLGLVHQSLLTLLFGKSGLGKTSLLQAGLFPRLRERHVFPVYIELDYKDQAAALIEQAAQRLREEITIRGVTAPEFVPGESLWEYLHRADLELWSADNWQVTPLFVFDQFETIFTMGAQNAQRTLQLRIDLADLVENRIPSSLHERVEAGAGLEGIDLERHAARVLISFREDFLPEFEAWRCDIPSLMRNRFRLMPMDAEQANEAVYNTGRKVLTEEVAREIVKFVKGARLRTGPHGLPAAAVPSESEASIEPSLLSVLCTGLNQRRKEEDKEKIDVSLLQTKADEIIDEFYRRAVAGLPERALNFLEEELITESGHRDRGALEDAQREGLDEKSLEQLVERRAVRVEVYAGVKWLELTHDLLTPVVRAHRDQRRQAAESARQAAETARSRQKIRTYSILGISLLVLGVATWALKQRFEYLENTSGAFESLREMTPADQARHASSVFEGVVRYLLWKENGDRRLDTLAQLLKDKGNQKLLPNDFGIHSSGMEYVNLVEQQADWPLTLRFSSDWGLDQYHFSHIWHSMARSLASEWGIPAPMRLKLVEEPILPRQLMRLEGAGFDALALEVPGSEGTFIISSKELPPQAQEFFAKFSTDWKRVPAPEKAEERAGPWWTVPRWSLPVWKVSGQLATEGSGFPAFLLALELQTKPEALLTPQAVQFLLDRLKHQHSMVVREAQAARGQRLPQDLIEIVRDDRAIVDLPVILDVLANHADLSSEDIAAEMDSLNSAYGEVPSPAKLHGPWTMLPPVASQDASLGKEAASKAYEEVKPWLPTIHTHPIRVYLGKELEASWTRKGHLAPALSGRLEELRDDFFRRFGTEFPGIGFRDHSWDPSLADAAFRIELLNESATTGELPIETDRDSAMGKLMEELTFRGEWARAPLLSAEQVEQARNKLTPDLQSWLDRHYSLTDLKLLLRAVIEASRQELDERSATDGVRRIEVPAEDNLRQLEWLLRSLVFWSGVDDPHFVGAMRDRLRETQRARLQPVTITQGHPSVSAFVSQGMKALSAGKLSQADAAFSQALAMDRDAAIHGFLAGYPADLFSALRQEVHEHCKASARDSPRPVRLNLEDLWRAPVSGTDKKERRHLGFCLLRSYPDSLAGKRNAVLNELLTEFRNPKDWPPDEAAALALDVFRRFDPLIDDPPIEQQAATFLESAMARQTQQQPADPFAELVTVCAEPGPKIWCWRRADRLAQMRLAAGEGGAALELANRLSVRERREDLERALILLKGVETTLEMANRLSAQDLAWKRSVLRFVRARALSGLVNLGEEQHASEAESLLRQSLRAPYWIGESAHVQLVQMLVDAERYEDAGILLQEALREWGKSGDLYSMRFWQQLLSGNKRGATETAANILHIVGKTSDSLFTATIGQFLTDQPGWVVTAREFLATDHTNVPYVALLLYAYEKPGEAQDEAKQLLLRRWEGVDSRAWAARLKEGDANVWREMLIGYYLGEIDRSKIFDPLTDDASFGRSDLSHIPLPRRGMLCEAWFYDALLAKARGDFPATRNGLRKVLETRHKTYIEYDIAKLLLGSDRSGETVATGLRTATK